MSTTNLGRSEGLDKTWLKKLSDEAPDRIEVRLDHSTSSILQRKGPLISDYPTEYSQQDVIEGEISYFQQQFDGSLDEQTKGFMYRSGSGLFILDVSKGYLTPEKIFREINNNVAKYARIEENLQLSREALWNFFLSADERLSIQYVRDGEQKEYDNSGDPPLDAVIRGADVMFQYEGESITVHYDKGMIRIPRVSEIGQEYVLELFEREVIYPSYNR